MLRNIRNSRGEHAVKIKIKNRQAILDFIDENPMCSQGEICEGLKMSRMTLHKHLVFLKKVEDAELEKQKTEVNQ